MSTTFINNGTVVIHGSFEAPQTPLAGNAPETEVERGADPDVIADIGYGHDQYVEPDEKEAATEGELDEERIERLAASAQKDAEGFDVRKIYLEALVETLGKTRRLEGFIKQGDKEPKNREAAEAKLLENKKDAERNLKNACRVCPLAGSCAIKGSLEKWEATHPYADSDRRKAYAHQRTYFPPIVEGRMKFIKELDANILKHCVPKPSA